MVWTCFLNRHSVELRYSRRADGTVFDTRRCGVEFIFWVFAMTVVLRCSLPLALKLGAQLADTERHLEQMLADEAAIQVAACSLRLYWPWQLGRPDRAEARRNSRLGE